MKSDRVNPLVSASKRTRRVSPEESSQATRRVQASSPSISPTSDAAGPHWTFLTNHSHVLVLLSRNPSLVLREVALHVGITERAVQRIISDLEAGGIIEREKVGRQNHYRIRSERPLRHVIECHRTIGEFLALINGEEK